MNPRTRVRHVGALVLLATAMLLGPAPAAQAHATLLFATPAVEGAVPTSPEQIQLVFDQSVRPAESALELRGPGGEQVGLGEAASGEDGRTITAPVLEELAVGQYVVDWTATAADGDTMTGEFRFAVGSSAGLALGGGAQPQVEGWEVLTFLRWGMFAGLTLSLGGLVGARLTRRTALAETEQDDPRPLLRTGVLLGLVSALGLAITLLGEGSLVAGASSGSPWTLLESTPGRVAAVEVLAFAVAGAAMLLRRHAWAGVALVAVAGAEGIRAHPQAANSGWGAVLIFVHLGAASIWVGALVHVLRVGRSRRNRELSATTAVAAYARLALGLFAIVLATGTISGVLLAGPAGLRDTLFGTTYGRWLLVKITLVLVIAALALLARLHLKSRPELPQPGSAARSELVGLAGALAVSALLTSLSPPVPRDPELPFPPPPLGPISAAGGRAGWIGVGATASEGQLLVRLSTPDTQMSEDAVDTNTYDLDVNLTAGGTPAPRHVPLRCCGPGCFVAAVDWQRGQNTVTFKADSADFPGGTTAVTVAWPPRQAPALLRRTVRIMKAIPELTLYERVTSNTNTGLGNGVRLQVTGQELLDSDPYGSGVAPTVVVIDRDNHTGETVMALAYPGEGTYVRLTLDRRGRILRETLAAPNHLTTRSIVYPEDKHDLHQHEPGPRT